MFQTKTKQIFLLSGFLLSGFLLTSIVSYFSARVSFNEHITKTELPLTSDVVYSEVVQSLKVPVLISSLMAQSTFVRQWVLDGEQERAQIETYLSSMLKNENVFTAFFISERTHQYYHPSGIQRSIHPSNPENEWYFRAKDMSKGFEVIISVDEMNANALVVFTNYRLLDETGEFLGVIGVGVTLTTVKSLLDELFERFGSQVYFIDKQGNVMLSGSQYDGPASLQDNSELQPYALQILSSSEKAFKINRDNKDVFITSRWLPIIEGYLIIERPGNQEEWFQDGTLISNLLIAIIFTLVVLGLANLTLRRYQLRLESQAHLEQVIQERTHQLKEKNQQLAQSEKMASLGTLVAGVAHEINNPNNFVFAGCGAAQHQVESFKKLLFDLLEESDADIIQEFETRFDQIVHSLESITNGGERIQTIVDDLRTFSRVDTTEVETLPLSEHLSSTIRLIQTRYQDKIVFDCDVPSEITIQGYASQLSQVFMNVIMNGCQAIEHQHSSIETVPLGYIQIQAEVTQNEICLHFRDNGIGMAANIQDKVFDPFFTTKPAGEGTGLGLAISFGIMQRHQGRITIQSTLGEGTCVSLFFPQTPADKSHYSINTRN